MNNVAQLETYRKSVPSLFATTASPKMSERYAFISTADLITPLLKEGFSITTAYQRSTRRTGRDPRFTRHLVRLRPPGVKPIVGDTYPEVVIINSHDGQCRFCAYSGLFRLACSNGLVVGAGMNVGGSYVHMGDPHRILEAVKPVVASAIKVGPTVEKMSKLHMNEKSQAQFAREAAKIAYGDDHDRFDPTLLLTPRRDEDKAQDLWHVFNRVQENVTRGGISFLSPTSNRRFTTRGITHIGRTVDFNLGLWAAAVKLVA